MKTARTPRTLIVAGLASLIAYLIAGIPASIVTNRFADENISLEDVSGTVWRGNVRRANIMGFEFTQAGWSLHPLQLLIGRLAADIETGGGSGSASGLIGVGLGGSLDFREFEFSSSLAPIAKLVNLPSSPGRLSLTIDELSLRDGWPRTLVGTADVTGYPLLPNGTAPAGFRVTFTAESQLQNGDLIGAIEDTGGPLEVSGTLRLIPPANYEVSGRIRPRGEAPTALLEGLTLLGPADASGRRKFSLSGSV